MEYDVPEFIDKNEWLQGACAALYGAGSDHVTRLALDIDVSHRTALRWFHGDRPMPEGVVSEIRERLDKRAAVCEFLSSVGVRQREEV